MVRLTTLFLVVQCQQGSLSPSSSAKVVACILALRSYHEWKQGGALGFWRLKSPNLPTVYGTSPSKTSTRGIKAPRKWFPTDQDYADNMELFSPSAQSTNSMSFDKDSRASFEGMLESVRLGLNGSLDGDAEDLPFNTNASGCYN